MTISEIKIRKTFDEGNLKAIASVVLDNCFAVHDIKVIQGNGKIFVAMPSRKGDDGTYRDIVHPMCPDVRSRFEEEMCLRILLKTILQCAVSGFRNMLWNCFVSTKDGRKIRVSV